jgi:hypothetical protein
MTRQSPVMAISGCDQQLIDQWKNEPAPLLPLLHAFHNRDRLPL